MATFAERYIGITKKVQAVLEAEMEAGGLLENKVKAVYWGGPTRGKRDIDVGERVIFVSPNEASLSAYGQGSSVGTWDVPQLIDIFVMGRYLDVDESLEQTVLVGGDVVEIFSRDANKTLGGLVRQIHNPEGGPTFTLVSGFEPERVKKQDQFINWVHVLMWAHWVHPV